MSIGAAEHAEHADHAIFEGPRNTRTTRNSIAVIAIKLRDSSLNSRDPRVLGRDTDLISLVFLEARIMRISQRMQKSSHRLIHWELTERIIGVYHDAYHELGGGFLEKVCHRVMVIALSEAGLQVTEGLRFDVHFRGQCVGQFFPDIVVNGLVLIEVKSCPALEQRHKAQVINYLRASPLEVGLLLNFGPKREIDRIVYSNERKMTEAIRQSIELGGPNSHNA
jgi:GxxExxY protein